MCHHVPLFVPLRVCLRVLGNSQDTASFSAAFNFLPPLFLLLIFSLSLLSQQISGWCVTSISRETTLTNMLDILGSSHSNKVAVIEETGMLSVNQQWDSQTAQTSQRKPKTTQCFRRFAYYQRFVKWLSKSWSAICVRSVWNCLVSTISHDGYRRHIPLLS